MNERAFGGLLAAVFCVGFGAASLWAFRTDGVMTVVAAATTVVFTAFCYLYGKVLYRRDIAGSGA